ncbi:AAA domain-containing protein [Thauera butanivorans]|uniref:AAA domain-containing protein n=1 Tax=Thauera butanivorans TaxID=86174 RepID=UPI003AB7EF67
MADEGMTKTTNEGTLGTTLLLSDLYQLVHDEQQAAHHQLMTAWERPLSEKLQKGITQGFLRLERGPEPTTLWAYPDDTESRFREGDLVCLHQGNALEPLCRGLSFELEEDDRWLLRGNRAMAAFDDYTGGACYVDPDTMDLTGYYKQALEDITTSAAGRDTLLPLLSGQLEIAFDEDDMAEAIDIALAEGCNDRQAEAVGWAHGARQVACIQGPPGTGKTRVLALIARLAVARGERILMTSHTHMAINNALNKVHAQGVSVVKVGRATQRRGLDDAIPNFDGLDAWEDRPTDGYVVGATPFATCTSRLENYAFDTILFDEASQITAPLALMAMRKGSRFIFIGDQRQLPPVLLSRSVLDKETHSVFSRLTAREAEHLVMLDETYRMNRWLTDWPSRAFYGGALRAAGENRERRLRLRGVPARFAAVLDGGSPAVFIPTPDISARTKNWREAELVADLCEAIVAGGLPLAEIGIVSPYRAQGRVIRTLLAARFGREAARQVVADTVERMQGQERELIILSLATGDEAFLGAIAEFFFQPERLNVSITRAMTKLIVIGPESGHLPDSGDATIRQWIASYRDMIGHCRRVAL